jgi:excinuclease ABC subunit B
VYNAERGIVPQTILKPIRDSIESLYDMDYVEVAHLPDGPPEKGSKKKGGRASDSGPDADAWSWPADRLRGEIEKTRADMLHAASELRFEDAARLRNRLQRLEQVLLAR